MRKGARELFSEFWPYTRGDRLRLLGGGLLSLVLMGAELGTVALFEAIVGRVLERHHLTGFWVLAGAWLAIAAAGALAMAGSRRLAGLAAGQVQLRLRDAAFSRAQRRPADYFDERRLGDLLVRLTDDVAVVENAIASGPVTLVTSAVSVVAFAAAALVIRWGPGRLRRGAGLLAAGPGLLRPGTARRRRRTCRQRLAGQRGRGEPGQPGADPGVQPAGRRVEAAAPGGGVLAAGHDGRDEARLAVRAAGLLPRDVLRAARLRGGARDVAGGRLSLAGLLAFAACLAYLYPPVQSLSGLVLSLSEASASAARLGDILGARPAVAEEGWALRGDCSAVAGSTSRASRSATRVPGGRCLTGSVSPPCPAGCWP